VAAEFRSLIVQQQIGLFRLKHPLENAPTLIFQPVRAKPASGDHPI
jgi:hypothetical protein